MRTRSEKYDALGNRHCKFASSAAHPQIREITIPLLKAFKEMIPVVFDDIDCS